MSTIGSTRVTTPQATTRWARALARWGLVCGGLLVGCATPWSARSADQDRGLEAVSRVEPRLEAMPPSAPPTHNAAAVASEGDCAPRYANGLHGACINHEPCRGFGVRDANEAAMCACYATRGGCKPAERCDAIKKACVPENEPGLGRAADD